MAPAAVASEVDDAGPLLPGQAFGVRYHIIRLLGSGGMGAVYHAWDAALEVSVAIKVIRPEIMADSQAAAEVERRFKRELLLARQVTHKNVVRIHDLGEIGGIKYITMSFVDGVDLATLLKEQGKLPVPTVVRLARSLVSGLVAAHTAGVVHRDLKPANIMFGADQDALIMDFGIARSSGNVEAAPITPALAAHLRPDAVTVARSKTGGIVGTVEYMAPEQASGREVDQRADIYSFGLILYDSLLGPGRSARAKNPLAELRSRMERGLPPARSIEQGVPEAFDALISRCLDPDPAKRFQTTGELEADLDRLDDAGEPIPVKRVVGLKMLVAVITLALALLGGSWWYARTLVPEKPHDPISVVVADIRNGTGDPAFDRTLEPALMRAFEGAGFISAYDRNALRSTYGVRPPEVFDETAARALASQQGLGVVLSGLVDRQGGAYQVSLRVAQTVTGNVISNLRARAATKEDVPGVATKLMASVRKALGDRKSDSDPIFANTSLSTKSLEVLRYYAAAQEAQSNGNFEQARMHALKMVELEPDFGEGYQLVAAAARNLGRLDEAKRYISEAMTHLSSMTERERFSTRGMFYRISGNYQECVKSYDELIKRYAGDLSARNQVALCASYLRDLQRARDEMQRIVDIVPKRTLFHLNLAVYAAYAGDFKTAEAEARKVQEPNVFVRMTLAFAQAGSGNVDGAVATYRDLATMNARGASIAASGLGDLATYRGRYADAVGILERGAAADLQSKNPELAAAKYAALAYAELMRGQKAAAIAAAGQAYANSTAVKTRFLAARIYVEAGDAARARPLMASLAGELQTEPLVYAKLLEGNIALKGGDPRQAITAMVDANKMLDTWIGNFDLGRAYLAAGAVAEADGQFDRCVKRKGEALALFLDEEPTLGYFPPVLSYQARVREALTSSLR